ncbi:nucleotide exchange factor GrpE [Antrihabitans cavernicola]|uniref:Protein GrpE n=1 Tax=Antrihabitans cavernicola TaxID=2495913 RepID=A0A5A7S694_9NOCA|nr:nucleotide exchange factor GrpE [Spelaeibacter cavernicola]KAA0018940.1 nucleotide exchange factor GrpE [Spelaeibacter cavernicola]
MTGGRGERSDGGFGAEQEPVTFVDKRKIDPDTGEVRDASQQVTETITVPTAAPQPGSTAAAAQPEPGTAEVVEPAAEPDSRDVELAERTADLQRLSAEYANFRKRADREKKAAREAGKESAVVELLGVVDDLERARAHGDLETGPLKSLADKLGAALAKIGLSEFGTEGEPFDPNLHEAVQHEGDGRDPVIGVVMRKGYALGDRVLRHAMVGVTDAVAPVGVEPDVDEEQQ